jgi:hypothetical protein
MTKAEKWSKIAFLILGIGLVMIIAGCTKEQIGVLAPMVWGATTSSVMGL